MNPGRELDAIIAERIFGLDPKWFNADQSYYECSSEGPRLKHYSTNMADAWLVVEKLRESNKATSMHSVHHVTGNPYWT